MTLLTAQHKEAVNKTIIERLSTGDIKACEAQVGRFTKHLTKMTAKAKARDWGRRGQWPGDADRTYEDISYYIKQYEKHKDTPPAKCAQMVKGFKAGMSVDEAIKAFG
tara:strand:- start:2485 stop:2808 length:324 start_codon:yes stop_codon:yes gene_type:complete